MSHGCAMRAHMLADFAAKDTQPRTIALEPCASDE